MPTQRVRIGMEPIHPKISRQRTLTLTSRLSSIPHQPPPLPAACCPLPLPVVALPMEDSSGWSLGSKRRCLSPVPTLDELAAMVARLSLEAQMQSASGSGVRSTCKNVVLNVPV
jgi:hypothetical protein